MDKAILSYKRASRLHRQAGKQESLGWIAINMGDIYRKLNNWDNAKRWYKKAASIGGQVMDKVIEGWALDGLGDICIEKETGKEHWNSA